MDRAPGSRYNGPMIDAFQLITALTRRPDTVATLLADREAAECGRVTTTLFKLAAAAREQALDDTAGGSRVARQGRDN